MRILEKMPYLNCKIITKTAAGFLITFFQAIIVHCSHHVETNQLVYRTNQKSGSNMNRTLVVKGLRQCKVV